MELPQVVGRMSVVFSTEEDHGGRESAGGVAVERTGVDLVLDVRPSAGNQVPFPQIGPFLQVRHPTVNPHGLVV